MCPHQKNGKAKLISHDNTQKPYRTGKNKGTAAPVVENEEAKGTDDKSIAQESVQDNQEENVDVEGTKAEVDTPVTDDKQGEGEEAGEVKGEVETGKKE